MKLSPLTLLHQRKEVSAPLTNPLSQSLSEKTGRFFRSRPRFRFSHTHHSSPPSSTNAWRDLHSPSSSSPTTIAFRIAYQKQTLYAKRGVLPLSLDSEVAIMQFVDGGSRTDAAARLGATYNDAAGAIYTDEAEAAEFLPLLLAIEGSADDTDMSGGLMSSHSGASEILDFVPVPLTPPRTSTPLGTSYSSSHFPEDYSRQGLFSIPARGGGSSAARYLHTTLPSLIPGPSSSGLGTKTEPASDVQMIASRRKKRRRPAALTLHLPFNEMGFKDSFAPSVFFEAQSPTAEDAEGNIEDSTL